MRWILLSLAALAVATSPSLAQHTPRDIADAYMDAYERQDFEAMRAHYAEDAVFLDPTSFDRPEVGQRIEWQGADAITRGVGAWGVAAADYTVDRSYASSGRVVYIGTVRVTYALETGPVSFDYPITTIITVADGRVAEHRDYTDFDGARRVEED